MAGRSPGSIYISLSAGTSAFIADLEKANASVTSFGAATQESAGRASRAIEGLKRTFEGIGGAGAAAFAAQTESATGLLNTYRALRLAISPTLFTGLTIGTGIAIEAIARMTAAQARAIDIQSLFAAKSGLAFEDIQRLGFAAGRAGAGTQNFVDAYGKLSSRLENSGTRSALKELDVDFLDVTGSSRSAQAIFGELGSAFEKIEDPADKARLAVTLFGSELGEKMLPFLNQRLADNVKRFEDWSLALDPGARKAVAALRNEVRDLIDNFVGVGDAAVAAGSKLKQGIVVGTAEAVATFRGLNTELERARNQGPVGEIAVPINPPSQEALDP